MSLTEKCKLTKQDNLVSMVDHKLPELRSEVRSLTERLEKVIDTYLSNAESFDIVAGIALEAQACQSLTELNRVIAEVVVEKSADKARLYLLDTNLIKLDGSLEAIKTLDDLSASTQMQLNAVETTHCDPCRATLYQELIGPIESEMGSLAFIPVAFEDIRAVLVIGSHDATFYSPEVGTDYLEFLGATIARTLHRLAREPALSFSSEAAAA